MKRPLFVSCFAAAFATFLGAASLAASASEAADRAELTRALIGKWSAHVEDAYPMGAKAWSVEMAPAFAEASMEELRAAASAKNFDDMNSLLLGTGGSGTNAIGDLSTDLVFVPVSPCRLFDTRLAGGSIPANTVRAFDVTAVGDFAFQGGASGNCGVGLVGSFAAAVINFTVVNPSAAGFITAYPVDTTQPNAATLNYAAGSVVGNSAIVKLDQGAAANELNVYTFANTHLVGDIVGYFAAPGPAPAVAPKALECVELVSSPVTITANGTNNVFSPACAVGYTKIEVQCRPGSFDLRLAGSWSDHCNYFNAGAASATATAAARCCRVPGG